MPAACTTPDEKKYDMLTTKSELLEQIRLGEDNSLGLKEIRFAGGEIRGPQQDAIADELAAFANTRRGGVLLLGVRGAPREVLGIPQERLDDVESLVRRACRDSLDPPLAPKIERLTLPDSAGADQPVLRVEVTPSLFIHYSPGGCFLRVGSAKRQAPPDHLARLVQQRRQARFVRFDLTTVPQATIADLDEALWGKFVRPRPGDTPEQQLARPGLVAQDDAGDQRPTQAGVLLACRAPEEFLPHAFIQAVAYRGTTIVPQSSALYQRDARDLTGPLDQQIFAACDFVWKNMRIAAYKGETGGRQDIPQFDMLAVFEAVANAVAHRDYSMTGSKVRLRLFDDRLELFVPGSLPDPMTPDNLVDRQSVRNEIVVGLLARCPVEDNRIREHRRYIMDKRGGGAAAVLFRSEALSGRAPQYRLVDDAELILTIYAPPDA